LKRAAVILLIVSLVLTGFLVVLPGHSALAQDNREPVIFIPGWGEDILVFTAMVTRLKSWGVVCYPESNILRGVVDIRDSASKLARRVNEIKALTGSSKVDLVGHSEGGLIARYYIQRLGGVANVDDYVSIGTPHQGTLLALLGLLSPSAWQMVPGNPFLVDLNTPDCTPGSVKYTAIYTIFDEAVIPFTNAMYPDPTVIHKKATWFVLHIGMLWDPTIARWVDEALD